MNSVTQAEGPAGNEEGETRRDFIHLMAILATGGAAAAVVVPAVHQMNPDASVRALATKEVDIGSIDVGQAIKVMWQGKPVFIRRRTEEEIAQARADDGATLIDPMSQNANNPTADASDANRTLDEAGEWLVMIGVCTHLGCVPIGNGSGDFGGWFCPCHGSHYDTSGRIRKGPAPRNLDVPVAAFEDASTIKLG